jgi:hypothetical protein
MWWKRFTNKVQMIAESEEQITTSPVQSPTGSVGMMEGHDLVVTIPKHVANKTTRLKITKPMLYGRKAFLRKIHDFMSFLELDSVAYPIGTSSEKKAQLQNTVRKAIDQLDQVKRIIYDLNDFIKPSQRMHYLRPRFEIKNDAIPSTSRSSYIPIRTPLGRPKLGAVILPTKTVGSNSKNVVRTNPLPMPTEHIRIDNISTGISNPENVVLSNEIPTESLQIDNVYTEIPDPDNVVLSNEIPMLPQTSSQHSLILSDFQAFMFGANPDIVTEQSSEENANGHDDCIMVYQSDNSSDVDIDLPFEFTTKDE